MELVEGPTLAARLLPGLPEMDDALAIAHQIADALEAAHDAGIIHRVLRYGVRLPNLSRIQMSEVGFRWAYISRVPSGESRNARTVSQ